MELGLEYRERLLKMPLKNRCVFCNSINTETTKFSLATKKSGLPKNLNLQNKSYTQCSDCSKYFTEIGTDIFLWNKEMQKWVIISERRWRAKTNPSKRGNNFESF